MSGEHLHDHWSSGLIYPDKAFDSFPKHNFLKIHLHEFENIAQKLLTKNIWVSFSLMSTTHGPRTLRAAKCIQF